jgi:hypothetical protein
MRATTGVTVGAGFGVLAAGGLWAISAYASEPTCGPEIWKRVRSLRVVAPFDGIALSDGRAGYGEGVRIAGETNKVHVRSELRYLGRVPTAEQLKCLLDHGMADGLFPVLKDSFQAPIADLLQPLERELGTLAQEIDFEIERAKLAIEGTDDAIIVRAKDASAEVRKRAVLQRVNRADRTRERYVNVSFQSEYRWYRITKEKFPRVFELQKSEDETRGLRDRFLEGQVRDLLLKEGVAALEPVKCTAQGSN